jgi:hypothetical protein
MMNKRFRTVVLCGSGSKPSKTGIAHLGKSKPKSERCREDIVSGIPAKYLHNFWLPIA